MSAKLSRVYLVVFHFHMAQSGSVRAKYLKIIIALVIIVIFFIFIRNDDIFFCNIITRKVCQLHLPEVTSVEPEPLPYHLTVAYGKNDRSNESAINVVIVFAHVERSPEMKNKLYVCVSSLFARTSSLLHLHILTDNSSFPSALKVLRDSASAAFSTVEVTLYDVFAVTKPLAPIVTYMQPHFTYKQGAYYSDSLFFISIGLYQVLPLPKVIMIDIDVKFLADVRDLYSYFDKFGSSAVIGLVREQQPVYRHILHEFRRLHPKTRAGAPPPKGQPGFNSGVLLLNLEKMRTSNLYAHVIKSSTVTKLAEKYKFKGHLGDQDLYSLVSLDYEELFYVLPCTWNRQLCQWWQSHGYEDVFDEYYACSGKIKLLHGNCNTYIPE